ncbi:MAG: CDP-alcohol phosphatidyltransferase family protein [Candidatus Omnitrophota bacterium]
MNFADKVTSIRIILIPGFISLLIYSRYHPLLKWYALGVFTIAVLTDFFDGMVARIKKEKSELGQIIDPLADKLLLLSAFISLYLLGFNIYLWLVLVVVSRDLVILFGAAVLHFLKITVAISPSMWGKFTTFFQMATVLWILTGFAGSFLISIVTVIITLVSGTDYFLRGVRAFNAGINSSGR